MSKSHMFIPDAQVKHRVNIDHIKAAGKMMIKRKPDVVVVIGDWWDFESLSTYTPAQKIGFEQRSYMKDFKAGVRAMEAFLRPMEKYNAKQKINKKRQYKPQLVFTCGNHEYRVDRLVEQNGVLDGALPRVEDYLMDKGFTVFPFKQAINVDGVNYCHLCPQPLSAGNVGRAHLMLSKRNSSWSTGHIQILDYAVSIHTPRLHGLIAGSFYTHDEGYKRGANDHWRGLVYKTNVKEGSYDPEFISIDGLMEIYG